MAILGLLVRLGEVDKIADPRADQPLDALTRRSLAETPRVLAGQQAAGNDPIGIWKRAIGVERLGGLAIHRRMLAANRRQQVDGRRD